MAISLIVIIYFVIPQILAGKDPVLISITGAFFLMTVTLYITYGWNLKSHAAVDWHFFFTDRYRLTGELSLSSSPA